VYEVELITARPSSITVLNESEHPVPLTISNTVNMTMKVGEVLTVPISAGSGTYGALKLPVGRTVILLTNSEAVAGSVRISFNEEVF
jgi:hypothetical protein